MRRLAYGAIAAPILFTAAWLVLGFLSPGYTMWDIVVPSYSPIAQPVSGLGLGVTGPYMNAAFIVSGLLLFAGVVGIVSQMTDITRRARWVIGGLLSLAPVGLVVDGVFTLESFFVHFLGYLVGVASMVITLLVAARVLRTSPRWRSIAGILPWGSAITLALIVIFQATFDPTAAGANSGIAGLTERLVLIDAFAWYVVLAIVAMRRTAVASPSRHHSG